MAQKRRETQLRQTLRRGAGSLSGPCVYLAQTGHTAEKSVHLISMSLFYSPILTPLQDQPNPHQVLSQREAGSHGSPAVLRKAMKSKEQRVRSCSSSSELAGAQSTCESLSFAVRSLLSLQSLCRNPEAGDIYLINDSENEPSTSIHFKYLCPVPEPPLFQNSGLQLLWQRDSPGDSDTPGSRTFLLHTSFLL